MKKETEITLSPVAALACIILLLIAAGGVYIVKPELFNKYLGQVTSGTVDTLPRDSYLPQLEPNLKLMLKAQLLTEHIKSGAAQTQFDAIDGIKIDSITAEPIGYYQNELAFWNDRTLRTVKFSMSFSAGGQQYQAEGDFTVSGTADRISLGSVRLK